MAGFVLKNTLSDNGGVTRGICKMDAENNLTEVVETKNIIKTTEGAEADAQGEAAGREDGLRAGRLAEIKNTEREKKRADMAQSRIKELEAELKKYREKPTA